MGAKVALVAGGMILTYLRDDFAHIPWPGRWDLPGGGREGEETADACVLRELEERQSSWFFAGVLHPPEIAAICFGDEGQHWQMMPVEDFVTHRQGVPELQRRTRLALAELGW